MPWRIVAAGFGVGLPAVVALAIAAPALAARGHVEAVAIYLALEPFCHQDAARSWTFEGIPAAMCIRCMGAYLGAAAALLLRAPFSPRGLAWAVAGVGLTWGLEASGVAWIPETLRFLSGAGLGAMLGAAATLKNASV